MSRGHPAQLRQCFLIKLFKKLGYDPKLAFAEVKILLRHKLAASYAIQVGQEEQQVKIKLGFSDVRILRKNYVAQAPPLKEACVLPGGIFIPNRGHEFSDSD